MKIDPSIKTAAITAINDAAGRAASNNLGSAEQAKNTASLTLSKLASALQTPVGNSRTEPPVDAKKVAALKQAISSGEFQVNAEKIAARMIEAAQETVQAEAARNRKSQ